MADPNSTNTTPIDIRQAALSTPNAKRMLGGTGQPCTPSTTKQVNTRTTDLFIKARCNLEETAAAMADGACEILHKNDTYCAKITQEPGALGKTGLIRVIRKGFGAGEEPVIEGLEEMTEGLEGMQTMFVYKPGDPEYV